MIEDSTRLRRAIHLNDRLLVQRIIRNNPQLLANADHDDKSNTSLHLAAASGFTEVAALLIEAGHDEKEISRNADYDTPLMLAAQNGQEEVGRLLIRSFPHCISFVNKRGLDVLAMASQHANATALIPVLLSEPNYPASVHARDHEGNTGLHHASASGSLKALRILLSAGANPLAKNNHDWTPLAYSQTVAAEVYFKNLVAEFERRKVEGLKAEEERERQRMAGVRVVEDASESPESGVRPLQTPIDEEEMIGDALKRHWSPVERKRPMTPGSGGKETRMQVPLQHDWDGRILTHIRSRSSSGG